MFFWFLVSIDTIVQQPRLLIGGLLLRIENSCHQGNKHSLERDLNMLSRVTEEVRESHEKRTLLEQIAPFLQNAMDSSRHVVPPGGSSSGPEPIRIIMLNAILDAIGKVAAHSSGPLDEGNMVRAIELVRDAWKRTETWRHVDFDGSVFTRLLAILGRQSVANGFRDGAERSSEALKAALQDGLHDGSQRLAQRVPPTVVARDILGVGKSAVYALQMDLALGCYSDLVSIVFETAHDQEVFLFFGLQLAAEIWVKDSDSMETLKRTLDIPSVRELIQAAQKYGQARYPWDAARVDRFVAEAFCG
jgi:hypothetical protein